MGLPRRSWSAVFFLVASRLPVGIGAAQSGVLAFVFSASKSGRWWPWRTRNLKFSLGTGSAVAGVVIGTLVCYAHDSHEDGDGVFDSRANAVRVAGYSAWHQQWPDLGGGLC
jgi:hypothetical protein